jgi:ATP-dependent Clp protease ATP-binding subunit ClpB
MSEYMERHSVSRLIGAPPGYVGYEESVSILHLYRYCIYMWCDSVAHSFQHFCILFVFYFCFARGGQLTEAVRRRPYQVILLDEFEKAAREVSNVLLQVLDEGHLTDGQGRKVDFRNTIIIMTSNLGAQATYESGIDDQALIEAAMLQSVRHHFPPEFVNRLDDMVVFNRLSLEDMPRIVDIQMKAVSSMLQQQKVEVKLTAQARKWLATKGHDLHYGARPLKRVIYRYVLNPLATKILAGEVREGSIVELRVDQSLDELTMHIVRTGKGDVVKPINTELMDPEEAVIEPTPASKTSPDSMAAAKKGK